MARPKVTHDGFLVPNAVTVSNPRMAEPDQVDFNISAQALWGVIDGCLVTVAGSTASTLGGTVVINGVMLVLANSTAQIGIGGAQDRFDLLVADISGVLKVIPGLPAVDPVYPDPPVNATALAAVFCPAGLASFVDNVIDKRKFLQKALLTRVASGDPLIQNLNGSGNHYLVGGDGLTSWESDTSLSRVGPGQLKVHSRLIVEQDIAAGSLALSPGGVTADGKITGSNLVTGSAFPTGSVNGTIYQADSGRIYIRKNNAWEELATISGTNPLGTMITSLQPPSVMTPLGWIPLDGRTVTESEYGSLFTLAALQGGITGVAPNRSMVLPNATGRVMIGGISAGLLGGAALNQITLNVGQMPRHRHNVRAQLGGGAASTTARTSREGTHAHNTGPGAGVYDGAHGHPVSDPGHAHNGADFFGNASPLIALMWGGRNKIDALFNDRNHTYSVEAMDWIRPAVTNIQIGSAGSEHAHLITPNGDHDHAVVINTIADHQHVVTEDDIGNGAPIDITPAFLTAFVYVRS